MGQPGLDILTATKIMAQLMHRYGQPSIPELDQAPTRLHTPMDCAAPIEVMLCNKIQMFLLANPDKERQQQKMYLITYTLIKMTRMGMYLKAIEK